MTHLYIELNTGLTEEVNSSIISKLYELVISGDLDNTSDLKGRLHSSTAKEKHVTYLNNNFDELYILADTQYISFDDPDVETLMKRYMGTDEGVSLLDIQTFINSGKAFGDGYTNTHTNRNGSFCISNEERASINSFDEINSFNGVTSIAGSTFNGSSLTSIQLPSSITTLGSSVFGGCTSLTSVTGLSNITSLANGMFFNCSYLENTDLNFANLTSFGLQAFYNCTSYPFGDLNLSSATSIGKEVFRQCTGITKLTLNDNVSVTGDNVFWHCTNMTQADLGSGITITNNSHSMFSGCTSLTTVTGMSDVTIIPQYMFVDCTGLTSVDIDWSKITSVDQLAFRNCSKLVISTLSLPLLTTIGLYSFANTKVQSVSNLGSITSIPYNCFESCSELTSVTLPNTLTSLSSNSFWKCSSLLSINIPSSCTTLGNSVFKQCTSLSGLFDLSNITSIGQECFLECSNVIISNFPKISAYEQNTFRKIGNTSIVIPKEVTTIKNNCFQLCQSLQTLTFEQNSLITNIQTQAFYGCTSLLSVILPEGLTTIGVESFRGCDGLYTVDIPSTVTSLGNMAFYEIGKQNSFANQTTVIFRGNTPPTCPSTNTALFGRGNATHKATLTIYVPDAVINTYKSLAYLSLYASRIFGISQMPNS